MDYRELINLGLSEKEGKVYLAALEIGKAPVQDISKKSDVNRATTYVIIDGLMKKGLISSLTEGKKQYYYAESPDKLSLLFREEAMTIQRKQEYLDKLLPELNSLKTSDDKPTVRYFEGANGLRTMIGELFKIKQGSTVRMVYPADNVSQIFTESEVNKWRDERTKKDIKAVAIYTKNDGKLTNIPKSKERKIPNNKFPIKSDIAVYDNKIRIASTGDKLMGIIIEDQDIADTMKTILKLAWEASEKYDNEK